MRRIVIYGVQLSRVSIVKVFPNKVRFRRQLMGISERGSKQLSCNNPPPYFPLSAQYRRTLYIRCTSVHASMPAAWIHINDTILWSRSPVSCFGLDYLLGIIDVPQSAGDHKVGCIFCSDRRELCAVSLRTALRPISKLEDTKRRLVEAERGDDEVEGNSQSKICR